MSINITPKPPVVRTPVVGGKSVLENAVDLLNGAGISAMMDKSTLPWGIAVLPGDEKRAEAALSRANLSFAVTGSYALATTMGGPQSAAGAAAGQSVLENAVDLLNGAGISAMMDKSTLPWGIAVLPGAEKRAEAALSRANLSFTVTGSYALATTMGGSSTGGTEIPFAAPWVPGGPSVGQPLPPRLDTVPTTLAAAVRMLGGGPTDLAFAKTLQPYAGPMTPQDQHLVKALKPFAASQRDVNDAAALLNERGFSAKVMRTSPPSIEITPIPGNRNAVRDASALLKQEGLNFEVREGSLFTM